jgi:hypothetical protein
MRANSSTSWRLGAALAALGLFTAVGIRPARAQEGPIRQFTVDVDGTVATEAPGAPGVYAGDADATVHLTLHNTSVTETLGSANVLVPDGLVVTAVDGVAYGGGATLELRDLDLAAGASQPYTLTVAVATCAAAPPAEFDVTAKSSADYGGTDNDFTLDVTADTAVAYVGVCSLAFVNPPASALRTQVITRLAYNPSAGAVTVELRDAATGARATAATVTVGLTAARPGADPASGLGGTSSVASVNGLASFGPGPTLSISAMKYTLTASSAGLTSSAPSGQFDIVDSRTSCPTYNSCSTSATVASQSFSMAITGGSGAGDLLLSVSAADAPSFECADYLRSGRTLSGFEFFGGDDRVGTYTQVIPNGSLPLSKYQVCWAAPYVFKTRMNVNATVQGTKPGTSLPLYVGTLPDCSPTNPKAPCVSVRYYNANTHNVTLSVMASSADPWRY